MGELGRSPKNMPSNPNISLTDFVDFVSKNGTPRLNHVRALKKRDDYDPRTDFWKGLREGLVDYHKSGTNLRRDLDFIINPGTDKKKVENYMAALAGYKKFLGRKTLEWHIPQRSKWHRHGLDIRLNPELGLKINGVRHHLKLYFKAPPLKKEKADMIIWRMQDGLVDVRVGDKLAILDVRRGNLFSVPVSNPNFSALLEGEAAAFYTIWDALPNE